MSIMTANMLSPFKKAGREPASLYLRADVRFIMQRCKRHMPYVCQIFTKPLEGLNCALKRDLALFLLNFFFVLLNKEHRKARPLCLSRLLSGQASRRKTSRAEEG